MWRQLQQTFQSSLNPSHRRKTAAAVDDDRMEDTRSIPRLYSPLPGVLDLICLEYGRYRTVTELRIIVLALLVALCVFLECSRQTDEVGT
jgi:hypothetical protein